MLMQEITKTAENGENGAKAVRATQRMYKLALNAAMKYAYPDFRIDDIIRNQDTTPTNISQANGMLGVLGYTIFNTVSLIYYLTPRHEVFNTDYSTNTNLRLIAHASLPLSQWIATVHSKLSETDEGSKKKSGFFAHLQGQEVALAAIETTDNSQMLAIHTNEILMHLSNMTISTMKVAINTPPELLQKTLNSIPFPLENKEIQALFQQT